MTLKAIEAWDSSVEARATIGDFLDWMTTDEEGHALRFAGGREAALDRYFGIDRQQLEAERRELLRLVAQRRSEDEVVPA
jgi:hypothetical protein